MLLQDQETGDLVKVVDVDRLVNPSESDVPAMIQAGQEEQEPEPFAKSSLVFPSGEALPRCWMDVNYRNQGV
jgi:hypothetical protein